jgi:hypothetical protein
MAKKKDYITISVPNNITQEEIKKIRQQFKEGEYAKDYILNIIISGYEDHIKNFGAFLMAWIK